MIGVEVGVGVEVELEVLDLLAGAAKTEVLARERRKRKIDENFILVQTRLSAVVVLRLG